MLLLCLATGRSVRAVTPGKSAAVLGPKTQVRLYGRVNDALIQWLTIFVSKRKEVGFQIKNLVVDLVAAIVHQANIASLKRAAISCQDWEVVIPRRSTTTGASIHDGLLGKENVVKEGSTDAVPDLHVTSPLSP